MRGVQVLVGWRSDHPRVVDVAAAVGAALLAFWGPSTVDDGGGRGRGRNPGPDAAGGALGVWATVLILVGVAVLLARRRHPWPVWAITVLVADVVIVRVGGPTGVVALPLLALYTIGTRTTVPRTILVTAVTAGALWAAGIPDGTGVVPALSMAAFSGVAGAAGVAVRSYRAALESAQARVAQAEKSREEEAVRLITDERVRIARELHDVVAHHISVINVQAGVARHLMTTQPHVADAALAQVRESSRTVLLEMSTVLGLLRTGEDGQPTQPAPTLQLVPELLRTMNRAGLRTEWTIEGPPQPLDDLRELTAYRIVQESLTNALKHGTGTAHLTITHQPQKVEVTVVNPVPAGTAEGGGGGHGILGMQERIASIDGEFATGHRANGDFLVRAVIPRDRPR